MFRCPNCACPVVSAGQSATHFKYKCWADCCPDIFEIEKENRTQSEHETDGPDLLSDDEPNVSELELDDTEPEDPSEERKVDHVTR